MDTVKKNTEALLDATKEAGLEMKPQKTKYINVTLSQDRTKAKHKDSEPFLEDVAKLKHLGKKLMGENCMQEEIKSRPNTQNAYYYSVQSL
jgi:hypothetical protein